jgi:hypothetical protein
VRHVEEHEPLDAARVIDRDVLRDRAAPIVADEHAPLAARWFSSAITSPTSRSMRYASTLSGLSESQ